MAEKKADADALRIGCFFSKPGVRDGGVDWASNCHQFLLILPKRPGIIRIRIAH